MATYTTKRCPYCGYTYQFLQTGEQRKYGCPFQKCMRCGKTYWEPDIKEPALYGFSNFYEIQKSFTRYITVVLYSLFGIALVAGGIFTLISEIGLLFSIPCFLLGGFQLWATFSEIQVIIHEKRTRHITIAQQDRDYTASFARLQNTDYLKALAEYDSKANRLLYERENNLEEHYADPHQIRFSFRNNPHNKAIITFAIILIVIVAIAISVLAVITYINKNYDIYEIRNFWRRFGF